MKIVLTIATILFIFCSFPIGRPAVQSAPPQRFLAAYDAPLNTLFPESVGILKKLITQNTDDPPGHFGEWFQTKAAHFARYRATGTDEVWISAFNFESVDQAKIAIRKVCRETWPAGTPNRPPGSGSKELSRLPKVIDSITVGERCASFFFDVPATGILRSVVWTNGSVLFILESDPFKHTTTYQARANAILTFERNFRY